MEAYLNIFSRKLTRSDQFWKLVDSSYADVIEEASVLFNNINHFCLLTLVLESGISDR